MALMEHKLSCSRLPKATFSVPGTAKKAVPVMSSRSQLQGEKRRSPAVGVEMLSVSSPGRERALPTARESVRKKKALKSTKEPKVLPQRRRRASTIEGLQQQEIWGGMAVPSSLSEHPQTGANSSADKGQASAVQDEQW